jgi:hypothetical protein
MERPKNVEEIECGGVRQLPSPDNAAIQFSPAHIEKAERIDKMYMFFFFPFFFFGCPFFFFIYLFYFFFEFH